jgi:hypothetical protein
MPVPPRLFGCEKVVSHVAEKLDLHDVNFFNLDTRDFGPCLVGIGIVVEEFITQHKCNCQKSILAAQLASNSRIPHFQLVYE